MKKIIAVLLGDPSGVGPELVVRLLNENITNEANIVVIGEKKILEEGEKISGKKIKLEFVEKFEQIKFDDHTKFFLDISKGTNRIYKRSEVSVESGQSVLEAMDLAMDLAKNKKIHAVNFGPFNKTSLIKGGCKYNDEHDFFQNKLEIKDFCCEFNVVDNFWTARVTSHIPIKEVAENITKENILKPFLRHTGPCISPFNAWVLLKSLETIELRVNKQSDQALEIAKILESNSNVEKVNYPFLNSFNQFDLAQKQMRKGSNMISFTIKGTKENAYNVINKLKLFDISNNLGDTKSLVTHPATTTHRILPEDERLSLGITDKLIRLSIGLENIEDIKNDLDLALKY